MGTFQDQVFLVTGASSGIGREVALQLLASGAKVVAEAVLKGIARRKRAVYPAGLKERVALVLARWAPPLLDRVLARRASAT